jgi:hypothetical protein
MKIIIILLALGLCLADAVPGGYQQLDITEAQADSTIQSYIQTGLSSVVQNAINKGFFSNSDFTLASINSVAEQVVNGANYKFDCNFTDSTGVVIQANFVIHQSATTNATTVTSFAYKVYYPATTTTTTTTTTTSDVPTTTVETEEDSVVEEESGDENAETAITESAESGETAEVEATESGENAEAATTESAESGETGEADTTTTTTTVTGQADTEVATTTTTDAATNSTETSTEASVNTTAPATNETADGFTAISSDEFSQSDDLRKHFTFGFETVVQNGINSGKIPNTAFTSAKVLGASYKAAKNGVLYKFTAEASNGDGVDLELAFQVVHRVPAYSYKVTITTTTPANNTDDNSTTPVDTGAGGDNTTTPVDTGAGSGSDNTTTPVDNGSGSGSDNTTTPVDNGSGSDNNSTAPVDNGSGSDNNTTTPVDTNTTTPSADEWTVIDLAQAQQSAEIQANLAQGFNQVIQTVVQKKLLAADNYTITQLVAVSSHNLTKGVNYKFTVKANNDDQTFFLDMNFTTYYRYSNQSVKTVSYHYNYSTKAAPVQNNTTPTQNNTTPAQNNTSSNNGYVALSATEIQAQDVQNAINYGSSQVVQLGIQKNKIPGDTYNITNVASVLKKIQPSGANYNATVTLQSAANVTVNTNFNVYYNSTSGAMTLKAYSYGVTGIKKN